MSQWARENPERYEEIAALPLNQQNAALRDAIGYDPDAIRDYAEERVHHHRDLSTSEAPSPRDTPTGGPPSSDRPPVGPSYCPACGAPKDAPCAPWCEANR